MLTLVAVLLHPPILHPSSVIFCVVHCSSYALERICRDPIDAVCINDKTAYDDAKPYGGIIACFFEGKYVEKRGWWEDLPLSSPFHSMHHLASHWSQFAIERNQSSAACLNAWCVVKKPTWYANDLSQNLLIKRLAKMWFCMQWIISIEHSQKHIQIICVTFYIASIGH